MRSRAISPSLRTRPCPWEIAPSFRSLPIASICCFEPLLLSLVVFSHRRRSLLSQLCEHYVPYPSATLTQVIHSNVHTIPMRSRTIGGGASALLLLATIANAHKGAHEHLEALHRRHREGRLAKKANESVEQNFELVKRGGQCAFPTDAGLVAVTPGSANAGWAMSPDQACEPGNYCPYACPPGQVSMQWDPKATSYTYPQSMVSMMQCQRRETF